MFDVRCSPAKPARLCIVGVGNRQRGDDGVGPRVIDARRPGTAGVWLDAGIAPENHLETIVRAEPDAVLIVDAVDFGGHPGQCRAFAAESLTAPALSTHAGSLSTLGEYLSRRTGAVIRVLAIQPENIDAREELSPPVRDSVLEVAQLLSDLVELQDHPDWRTSATHSLAAPAIMQMSALTGDRVDTWCEFLSGKRNEVPGLANSMNLE